ncbi:hypothetical protein, partial [Streptomyces sp. NPDC091377]|uniref:hypothetical protein n=1 Tax=Streptomyces sp. NPDC091377 TaxID=3365995 RepID=UPI00383A7D12
RLNQSHDLSTNQQHTRPAATPYTNKPSPERQDGDQLAHILTRQPSRNAAAGKPALSAAS